ncbi:MAG: 4-phosphoerythronate dehydrogenase [Candidatus Glassbacteria bacterium]|nr:4-phosphoerythronate dehydrogenase [Candidatus Glassbacteria bacterium]
MLTVADENMPFASEAFGTLGRVRSLPGRGIAPADLREADILAVRSVTRVNGGLLSGSRVRFVGTATIGTDHVDTAWLERAGIGFSAAPGCNAVSVAEYVVAALLVLARRAEFTLEGRTLGVIGVGNVGSRVLARAEALGMRIIANDPPLADMTGDPLYRPLEEALAADIITLHVPLTGQGRYPTSHLVDRDLLERVRPGTILINTSRGPVADTRAVKSALGAGRLAAAVLDVWENEPEIDLELLESTAIATPHIAGYSYDGKVNGTTMIYRAACGHFGLDPDWDPAGLLPPPAEPVIRPSAAGSDPQSLLADIVPAAYDILADDRRLRLAAGLAAGERGGYFDRLRKQYPLRREFSAFTVEAGGSPPGLGHTLAGLGFRVKA